MSLTEVERLLLYSALVPPADRRGTGAIAIIVSLVFVAAAYVLLRSGNTVTYIIGAFVGLWGMGGVAFGIKLLLGPSE